MPTLTSPQKDLLSWIVKSVEDGTLGEEFKLQSVQGGCLIVLAKGNTGEIAIAKGLFDVLANNGYLHSQIINPSSGLTSYTVTGEAAKAVTSNFAEPQSPAPNQSFATNIHGGSGFQFGNHNRMDVKTAVEAIDQIINESKATPEKKEEAKGALKTFLENSAVKDVLELVVSGTVKAFTE